MRIAQLTLDGYFNYGNILQKFALHYTLKKFADFTEVLWINSGNAFFAETGAGTPKMQCVLRKESDDYLQNFRLRAAVRSSKFKDFENLNIQTRFDFPYFQEIADDYDFFVVGSDQVWRPAWVPSFLEFVPREKKVSYAASIGINVIPDDKKEFMRRGISDFNYISVREESAIKIVKDLTGRDDAILVLDPVLLLTAEEWLSIAQKPTWFKGRYSRGYVLTYHLSKLPPPQCQILADKLDLPIINLLDTDNYNHFTTGPAEFVWLFANASLVCTNSFHGMAFSTLFKHPFVLNGLRSQNDPRLISFLKLFGLGDRFTPEDPMTIDFTRRDEVLPIEREKAFRFLSEAFGIDSLEKILGGDA